MTATTERWLVRGLWAQAIACIALGVFWPGALDTREPASASAGLVMLGFISWLGTGDIRRFRVVNLAGVFGGALAGVLGIGSGQAQISALLLLLCVVNAGLMIGARFRRTESEPWTTDKATLGWEWAIAFLASAGALFSIVLVSTAPLSGQTLSGVVLGILLGSIAWRARRNGQVLWVVAFAALLNGVILTIHGHFVAASALGLIAVTSGFLAEMAARRLLDQLVFLSPGNFRTLEALYGVVFTQQATADTPAHEVIFRVDGYLRSFRSERLRLVRLVITAYELLPILFGLTPLSFLSLSSRRDFLSRYFKIDDGDPPAYRALRKVGLAVVISAVEAMVRLIMQLLYMGYYGDPAVQKSIGYTPFSERTKTYSVVPVRRYPSLRVETPEDLRVRGVDVISGADVVVIGSGAAGAIVADQLAAQGRDVLVLERGLYVKPDEFSENEIDMLGRLYGDGALQMAESLAFNVIQGSCVGGSTVINNAVCFDTPDRVLNAWNSADGGDAGLDIDAFKASHAWVKERLRIRSVAESCVTRPWQDVLNPGDIPVGTGIARLLADRSHGYGVVSANVADCLGCGYCNIGCRYGRKLSMLDEILPAAQQKYRERLRILSEANVQRLATRDERVVEITVRVGGERDLVIRNPKTVVLSAGAISSSRVLLGSGIGRGELPVGRRLCFNMASPLHGLFRQELNSYAGLQIAHYLEMPDQHPGFVFESEFNPPIQQALLMPGWLDTHQRNMTHYRNMAMWGVLVGTEPVGYLSAGGVLGGPQVVYRPTARDLDQLVEALIILGRAMLAGGADEVLPATRRYRSYSGGAGRIRRDGDLDQLHKLVKEDRDIWLGSAHPQGGNPFSRRRGKHGTTGGVVNPEFQVYGVSNLYVVDASVFPSPTIVNPQQSVMAVAHYASQRIA